VNSGFEPEAIRGALERRVPTLVTPGEGERQAAVALILRPRATGAEVLFVKRAEVVGDPWSGHMALPGGHRDLEDADLLETARRETGEEVGVSLDREDFLGRLDDNHPRSRGLPAIVVSPFVAWRSGEVTIHANHEVQYHRWIPVSALVDPDYRSELILGGRGHERAYPSILFEGDSIWGLTHRIVVDFLEIMAEELDIMAEEPNI